MQDTTTINSLSLRLGRATWSADLPTGLKFVLLAIVKHINDDSGHAYPSIARIARLVGMHTRTVQTHLNKLLALGLVQAGRLPGVRVSAYRVCEEALGAAQMQPEFGVAMAAQSPAQHGAKHGDFSANYGDSFQKHAEITVQNGKELKRTGGTEERAPQTAPLPPAFASLPENQTAATPAAPATADTAPADITPASIDRLNDQRIVNGKQRLRPADLTQLRDQAALAGITPQAAVNWLLESATRNFFRAEFFRAAPAAQPTPAAPATVATPAAPAAPAPQPTPAQQAAAASAASAARIDAARIIAAAKSGTTASALSTPAASAHYAPGVQVPAHSHRWVQDAIAKALRGAYVAHAALQDACKVARICPKAVRAAAASARTAAQAVAA